MAGALVTPTVEVKDIGIAKKAEKVISLACLSDDATGLIPDQILTGLQDYVLHSVTPIPDGTAPVTSAFEIKIVDADGTSIFLSASIAVTSNTPLGGEKTLGWYPRFDNETYTLSIVDPSDHVSTLSVGNEKELKIVLRFEKKYA